MISDLDSFALNAVKTLKALIADIETRRAIVSSITTGGSEGHLEINYTRLPANVNQNKYYTIYLESKGNPQKIEVCKCDTYSAMIECLSDLRVKNPDRSFIVTSVTKTEEII